jgi:UDP-glucose 4-epimerase
MKKVLVTGGFGFVGSRLVDHLRGKNLEVVILEHPDAPTPAKLDGVQVLRADITSESSMDAAKCAGIDAVLHLAAQSSGPRSFSIPVQDVKLNVLGTVNTINWCLANDVDRLLFASSFVIYGDHPEREALDEETCCRPKSVYAGSKLACEHLLMNYAQPKGIRWNALRMFNVYGPGQDITKPDQGVVGIFMNMLLKQDEVEVKGSLERFRDLIFIDDVVQGWDKCLSGAAYNQSFNLGTGEKTSFDTLIRSLAKVIGKAERLRIRQTEGTPGDLMGVIADIGKIKSRLGYAPQVKLEQGLDKMLAWVRSSGAG